MVRRLLIANRGDVARRVIRTCRLLGIETVAVYSDADAAAVHVREADRAVYVGPALSSESYLSTARLVDAARQSEADAVHPGYGFLSENAEFAAACRDAGLTFVGPSTDVIAKTGSKPAVRQLAESVGVPVVPGEEPTDQTPDGLRAAVDHVGYPVLLKPAAGGGGKGMRVVHRASDIDAAVAIRTSRSRGRFRRRHALRRASPRRPTARRGAGRRRQSRSRGPLFRARLLHPTAAIRRSSRSRRRPTSIRHSVTR